MLRKITPKNFYADSLHIEDRNNALIDLLVEDVPKVRESISDEVMEEVYGILKPNGIYYNSNETLYKESVFDGRLLSFDTMKQIGFDVLFSGKIRDIIEKNIFIKK